MPPSLCDMEGSLIGFLLATSFKIEGLERVASGWSFEREEGEGSEVTGLLEVWTFAAVILVLVVVEVATDVDEVSDNEDETGEWDEGTFVPSFSAAVFGNGDTDDDEFCEAIVVPEITGADWRIDLIGVIVVDGGVLLAADVAIFAVEDGVFGGEARGW